MLSENNYQILKEIQTKNHVKNLSLTVNKCLDLAFTYQDTLREKEKTISTLQNIITGLGEKAEAYRNQLIKKKEAKKKQEKDKE